MKNKLTAFLDNSVLQAILTILVWGVIGYLYVVGREVPDALLQAGSVILGFYFHTAALASAHILPGAAKKTQIKTTKKG